MKENLQTSISSRRAALEENNDRTEHIGTVMARLASSDEIFHQTVSNSDVIYTFFSIKANCQKNFSDVPCYASYVLFNIVS